MEENGSKAHRSTGGGADLWICVKIQAAGYARRLSSQQTAYFDDGIGSQGSSRSYEIVILNIVCVHSVFLHMHERGVELVAASGHQWPANPSMRAKEAGKWWSQKRSERL